MAHFGSAKTRRRRRAKSCQCATGWTRRDAKGNGTRVHGCVPVPLNHSAVDVNGDRVTTGVNTSQLASRGSSTRPTNSIDDAQDLLVAVQERLLVLARAVRPEVHGLTSVVREEHSVANLDACDVWGRGTEVRI